MNITNRYETTYQFIIFELFSFSAISQRNTFFSAGKSPDKLRFRSCFASDESGCVHSSSLYKAGGKFLCTRAALCMCVCVQIKLNKSTPRRHSPVWKRQFDLVYRKWID